jgi:leader peptidase (prepilin peptidase)/N-methyltransferase
VLAIADLPGWLVTGVVLALGLTLGSFLNVVIHRLPRGESLIRPGSRCPHCGKRIRAYDNLPLLSFALLRGRARCCGARISVRYPLIELIGALLCWAIFRILIESEGAQVALTRAALLFALYSALGLGLVAAAFIDLEHMFLPDEITLGGSLLGFASAGYRLEVGWRESLFGAALGFLMIWLPFDVGYRALRGHSGMGLGDAKLTMLAGAWFGWVGAVFTLLAGAVQGTVVAITLLLVRGKLEEPEAVRRERAERLEQIQNAPESERARLLLEHEQDPLAKEPEPGIGKARIAFGPFLAVALLEYMLFGRFVLEGTFL